MPIANMLVDSATNNELLSFMDGFSSYNQILLAVEDIPKTAFRNAIFHDMLGHHMEVYIDDILVKSKRASEHVDHLRKIFERMRHHRLKLNPLQCAFGVRVRNFLGFLVHQKGI